MILSIESSCDDSSIALTRIEDCKLLYHKKISQELTHSLYGGVVPEIASRMHANALPLILKDLFIHFDKKVEPVILKYEAAIYHFGEEFVGFDLSPYIDTFSNPKFAGSDCYIQLFMPMRYLSKE